MSGWTNGGLPRVGMYAALLLTTAGCGGGGPGPIKVSSITPTAATAAVTDGTWKIAPTDWPQWRGAGQNGLGESSAFPRTWSDSENIAWSADVPGRGHASPVVVGDAVYLATARLDEQRQSVLAYSRADGKLLWESDVHAGKFPPANEIHDKATYANGTVACDGEHVYATFFNDGQIFASALSLDGKLVWQVPVGSFRSKFGYAPSPVPYRSLLIVAADNSGAGVMVGLDRATGAVVWQRGRPSVDTYSTPLVARIGEQDQLVISGGGQLSSYDPNTGEPRWSTPYAPEATCGTAVTDGQIVVVSGGYPDQQTLCVDSAGKTLWQNSQKVYEPSLIIVGNGVFAISDRGVAVAWDKQTGTQKWMERLGGNFSSSPVASGDVIAISNLGGETVLFRATLDKFEELSRNRLGNDAYASPALCADGLFTRVGIGEGADRKEKLYCLRTAAP